MSYVVELRGLIPCNVNVMQGRGTGPWPVYATYKVGECGKQKIV